jgi:two-component system, sensor histidine kinase and response regulator
MTKYSILVVDDEPHNFEVIEALLPIDQYQLHYASRGEEAITSLHIFNPDAILLDVMMPGLDGIEVCKRLKAMSQRQNIPIIMVTALTGKEDLARCLAAGADDFICKPVNGLELRARVASMLRLKQQYDRIRSLSKLQTNSIALLKSSLGELRGSIDVSFPSALNSSLHGILGQIRTLSDNLEQLSPATIRALLAQMGESAQRIDRSTHKLLMYLNLAIETPQRHSQDQCAVQGAVEAIATQQATRYHRQNDLLLDVEAAQLQITTDRLHWALDELLDNAFRYSPADSTVEVRGQILDGMFHLWVINQGEGIEGIANGGLDLDYSGDLSSVINSSATPQTTGLGLKIVKKIVEAHGGIFLLSSIYQYQTTVHITLPLLGMVTPLVEMLTP